MKTPQILPPGRPEKIHRRILHTARVTECSGSSSEDEENEEKGKLGTDSTSGTVKKKVCIKKTRKTHVQIVIHACLNNLVAR